MELNHRGWKGAILIMMSQICSPWSRIVWSLWFLISGQYSENVGSMKYFSWLYVFRPTLNHEQREQQSHLEKFWLVAEDLIQDLLVHGLFQNRVLLGGGVGVAAISVAFMA